MSPDVIFLLALSAVCVLLVCSVSARGPSPTLTEVLDIHAVVLLSMMQNLHI